MTEGVKLRPEEEERLRALLRRADALTTAYMAVEGDEGGDTEPKAQTLAVLEEMRLEAHERFASYRQELGIPGPLA